MIKPLNNTTLESVDNLKELYKALNERRLYITFDSKKDYKKHLVRKIIIKKSYAFFDEYYLSTNIINMYALDYFKRLENGFLKDVFIIEVEFQNSRIKPKEVHLFINKYNEIETIPWYYGRALYAFAFFEKIDLAYSISKKFNNWYKMTKSNNLPIIPSIHPKGLNEFGYTLDKEIIESFAGALGIELEGNK